MRTSFLLQEGGAFLMFKEAGGRQDKVTQGSVDEEFSGVPIDSPLRKFQKNQEMTAEQVIQFVGKLDEILTNDKEMPDEALADEKM
ncbi:hypothetical protein ACLOJK_007160 [Asimina triloba]